MWLKVRASLAVGLLSLAAAGCGSSLYTQATGSGPQWDGFGATLTAFQAAHPGCTTQDGKYGYCAGPVLKSPPSGTDIGSHQFYAIDTAGTGRVLIMNEALPKGTSEQQAIADVDKLLPTDVKMVTPIAEAKSFSTCGYYNLASKTLGKLLAGVGDGNGTVGVTFGEPVGPYHVTKLDPKSVTEVQLEITTNSSADEDCDF